MAYPSIISAISNPQASDRLNSPSHSSIHQAENTAITEIETFVGTLSSVPGTLVYDIRSANSNGGGHIQTTDKGGTGQTTYNKGDLLVASSSSVLTKLAIGADSQVLSANSSVATGVTWITPGGNKIATSGVRVSVVASAAETSLLSAVVPGSTLGVGGAVRATIFLPYVATANSDVGTFNAMLNTTSIAAFQFTATNGAVSSYFGKFEINVISTGVTSSQIANVNYSLNRIVTTPTIPSMLAQNFTTVPISIDSNSSILMGVTLKYNSGSSGSRADTGGYIVEKII